MMRILVFFLALSVSQAMASNILCVSLSTPQGWYTSAGYTIVIWDSGKQGLGSVSLGFLNGDEALCSRNVDEDANLIEQARFQIQGEADINSDTCEVTATSVGTVSRSKFKLGVGKYAMVKNSTAKLAHYFPTKQELAAWEGLEMGPMDKILSQRCAELIGGQVYSAGMEDFMNRFDLKTRR